MGRRAMRRGGMRGVMARRAMGGNPMGGDPMGRRMVDDRMLFRRRLDGGAAESSGAKSDRRVDALPDARLFNRPHGFPVLAPIGGANAHIRHLRPAGLEAQKFLRRYRHIR